MHTHTSQAIISDGVKVNASPSSLTLPPLSEPQEFDLLCIPLEAGELNILGYEATVFGVHNKCMVKISGVFPTTFSSSMIISFTIQSSVWFSMCEYPILSKIVDNKK